MWAGSSRAVASREGVASAAEQGQTLTAVARVARGRVLLDLERRVCANKNPTNLEHTLHLGRQAALNYDPPLITPVPEIAGVIGRDLLLTTVPPGHFHLCGMERARPPRDGGHHQPFASQRGVSPDVESGTGGL